MPVLIVNEDKEFWFQSSFQAVEPLLQHVKDEIIYVERAELTSIIESVLLIYLGNSYSLFLRS